MKRQAIALALLAGALAAGAPAHAETDADPVRAAFARMLDHTAAPIPAPRPTAADPLLAHLLRALPAAPYHRPAALPPMPAERIVAAVPEDPLAASFRRMLEREPPPEPAVIAGPTAADPLAEAFAARLWSPRRNARP